MQNKILSFVTTYHPALPNLKNILRSKWLLIQNQPLLREIFWRTYSYFILLFHTKKKKTVKKSKTITRSHNHVNMRRVWPRLSTLYLLITFMGTFFNSSLVENEVRSRTYILDALSSNFRAYKTHITSYTMHAAMLSCASMTRGRHLVSKVLIYANLHKSLCDVNGRHYNARNSDVSLSRAPCRLGRGDGWHFRLSIAITTTPQHLCA